MDGCVYVTYRIAIPGREREHGRFKGSREMVSTRFEMLALREGCYEESLKSGTRLEWVRHRNAAFQIYKRERSTRELQHINQSFSTAFFRNRGKDLE